MPVSRLLITTINGEGGGKCFKNDMKRLKKSGLFSFFISFFQVCRLILLTNLVIFNEKLKKIALQNIVVNKFMYITPSLN